MPAVPIATLKRVTEKLGYSLVQRRSAGPWAFLHDSAPGLEVGDYPSKRDAYQAALDDYRAANGGNVSLDGL